MQKVCAAKGLIRRLTDPLHILVHQYIFIYIHHKWQTLKQENTLCAALQAVLAGQADAQSETPKASIEKCRVLSGLDGFGDAAEPGSCCTAPRQLAIV